MTVNNVVTNQAPTSVFNRFGSVPGAGVIKNIASVPGTVVKDVTNIPGDVANTAANSVVSGITSTLKSITPPNFLVRSGLIVGGGILLIIGIISVGFTLSGKDVGDVIDSAKSAAKTAAKVAPTAAL